MGCGAEFLELHPYIEEDKEHQDAIVLPPMCSLPPMTGSQRYVYLAIMYSGTAESLAATGL
ncbi:protein of unknown function [Acidithiobacillus ferrivorans]|uniref:Uncharacterized protein n=1 Tax=Acidithiobacillus ferrivorans TaxID=160808 RepID=A0A060UPZ9_9PROT|nr:hypothetical protein AFERRI_410015 [Acidithiobacillus ferrivorans]SMH66532.1 protein of unknown function [Acidithiobacillus ferrivorans]